MLYLVRVKIDKNKASEWEEWMQNVHIPDVLATQCFDQAWMGYEQASDTQNFDAYRIIYLAKSRQAFERYQREFAPALQADHTTRFAGYFQAERELVDILQAYSTT